VRVGERGVATGREPATEGEGGKKVCLYTILETLTLIELGWVLIGHIARPGPLQGMGS
jgi:hypothetical protein